MDVDGLRLATTVVLFIAFLGIVAWAWSKRRERAFDEAARLPFEDNDVAPAARRRRD